MELDIEKIELFLLIASVVAMLTRRVHLPYSVGLVLAGIALALFSIFPHVELTKELVFSIFLPPLIFEAALYIHWRELRDNFSIILVLATVGVLLSAAVTTIGMHVLVQWDWSSAALFGVLISATDPVSVIATFKEAGVKGRLRLLVEAESLFNDSTVAILFGLILLIATGGHLEIPQIIPDLVVSVGGGVLCGVVIGSSMLFLAGHTNDPMIELTFTTVAAYGSFLFAESFHASGVLASLTAGLLVGNFGILKSISTEGRKVVETFWEYIAFVINSLIFILIGIQGLHQLFGSAIVAVLVAIVLVIIGRAVAIYACCAFFFRSKMRVNWPHQHILFWGGLRGALALALALGLPPEVPNRETIITVAFGVVGFSIIIQGLSITPLLRKMGEINAVGASS
jgi:CPA1 family monovalent cation:H+ antiporter